LSGDDFRRELNDAFDRISGNPSSDLSARVRNAIVDAPERRGPVWLAGVAAAMIALLVVGTLIVIGPLSHRQNPVPVGRSSPTPSASPSPSPTDNLPAFVCGTPTNLTGTQSPQTAFVDAVRTGAQTGYDRFVVEFNNGQPASVEVKPQSNATFTKGASGQTVQLLGSNGLLVVIHSADEHTAYTGPTDFKTGYRMLLEAQQMEDFEATVQWGLGLAGPACYRAFFLSSPARLVIDVSTT
jgi:hypothetical protein